jgi:glycosyltransferase involved in cell wall biosynthesis
LVRLLAKNTQKATTSVTHGLSKLDGHGSQDPLGCVHYLRRVRLRDGGVVRAVLDTCSLLADRGHTITLLTTDAKDAPPEWKAHSKKVPRLVCIPPPRLFGTLPIEAESALRTAQVLHLHTPWDVSNLSLARRARRLKLPYIVSTHGMLDDWSMRQKWLKKRFFLTIVGRRFLAAAECVHCTAMAELAQASRYLRTGCGIVAPCPIDLSDFMELPGPERALSEHPNLVVSSPRLLFLGRLHPKKRPDLVIEAAAKLQKEGRPCLVILAGPGEPAYVAQLRQIAVERGLNGLVVFTGMVNGPVKVSLLQVADAFVLPTSQENFGIALVESMAAGTPVITTRGVDIWKELQSAGAIIVEQDSTAIASAIRSLITDRPKAVCLGRQGRAWAMRELNAETVVEYYERMYQGVMRHMTPK